LAKAFTIEPDGTDPATFMKPPKVSPSVFVIVNTPT
jgi:hypothetical protein